MSSTEERLIQERNAKLTGIRKLGFDPSPSHVARTHTAGQVHEQFEALEKSGDSVTVVGRVRALRKMGGAAFVVLEDGSGRAQIFVQKDELGPLFELVKLL